MVNPIEGDEQIQAQRRILSNAGVWLLGLEDRMKLGMRLVGDIQTSPTVVCYSFIHFIFFYSQNTFFFISLIAMGIFP